MTDEIKTSVRIVGPNQVDEFRALCQLTGRRPHQLAADMVLDAIIAARDDPDMRPHVLEVVAISRRAAARRENRAAPNVIDLNSRRR